MDNLNKVPNDVLDIIYSFKNRNHKCHTCLIKIENLEQFKKVIILNRKIIFCSKECYSFI